MPQLNTTIYFHEYGWMFFTFFFFYFIFLKYYLPKVTTWMKVKQNHLVYQLEFIQAIDLEVTKKTTHSTIQEIYKLFLASSLISYLNEVYKQNLNNKLTTSQVERTILNLLNSYKK